MEDFDDEPRTGGGYERAFSIRLDASDGVERWIAVRERGRFERVSVVLEEVRDGMVGRLVRFDDAHRRFHRHASAWPEPSPQIFAYFDDLPKRLRTAFAVAETKAQYTIWEFEVFGAAEKDRQ